MKKIITLMALMVLTLSANAVTFTVDGVCYQTSSGGVNVVSESSNAYNYDGLIHAVIPSVVSYNGHNYKVVRISAKAFWSASDLESIEIPNSVTWIGSQAISSCEKLRSVKISSSVKTIESNNLEYCPNLEEIWVDPENTVYDSRDSCNALIKTSTNELLVGSSTSFIPSTVVSIADKAFYNISGLETITIPSSVSSVGYFAFAFCMNLEHLVTEGEVTLGSYAFNSCRSLNDVQLGEGLQKISAFCFDNCSSLTSITIPESVTVIDSCAFSYCTKLESVNLGENLQRIGARAFMYTSLTDINIPDAVTDLGNKAFYECEKLKSAYIGRNIIRMGRQIFAFTGLGFEKLTIMCRNADYLTEYAPDIKRLYLGEQVESIKGLCINPEIVQCQGTVPPVCDENTFSSYYGRLYVPRDCEEVYSTAPYWENFSDIVDDVQQIAGDVNGDLAVTVTDVTAIYDILLGNSTDYAEYADVNNDGVVNVADVTIVYDMLLGNNADMKLILGTSDRVIFKSLTTGAATSFFNPTGYVPFDIFWFKGNNYLLSNDYNNRSNLYRFGEWGLTLDTMLGGYNINDCSVTNDAYAILLNEYNSNYGLYHYTVRVYNGVITSWQNADMTSGDSPVKMCLSEDGSIYVAYNKWEYPTSTKSYVCRDREMLYEMNINSWHLTKMLELDGDIYVFSSDSRYWKNGEEHSTDGITAVYDAKIYNGTLCLAGSVVENSTEKAVVKLGDVVYDFSNVSANPTMATCCEMVGDDLYTLVHDYLIDEEYPSTTWLFKNNKVIMTIENQITSKFMINKP